MQSFLTNETASEGSFVLFGSFSWKRFFNLHWRFCYSICSIIMDSYDQVNCYNWELFKNEWNKGSHYNGILGKGWLCSITKMGDHLSNLNSGLWKWSFVCMWSYMIAALHRKERWFQFRRFTWPNHAVDPCPPRMGLAVKLPYPQCNSL